MIATAASTAPAALAVTPGPAALAVTPAPAATASLPALPAAWPSANLELGLTDSPGGAAALHSSGAYKFRYQYLCGGVNTGSGWSTWNANAKFADYYVDESAAKGITPVFIYYQLLQSSPGGGDEGTADRSNLKNAATMKSYWADVRLLFQHLGAYSKTIVVDIEPDLWGYIQQAASADQGSSVPAAVAGSGDSDMTGLANNADGFAQGFVRLRDKYAPNVLLGYELSMWGTMTDPIYQNTPLSQIDALAARSSAFQKSLGARFDLVFTDPADRDAAFDQYINGDGGASWWDAADYDRFNRYVGDFVKGVGLRMVLWQIPLGNTKMRAMNNTWGHYQDNHAEWWLDDTTGHLAATVNSGVVAMLFGGGASGTTSASDAMGDGVTNPAAIGGNTRVSYSADDDGGYFRHQATAYYTAGAMPLPSSGATPPTPATFHPIKPVRLLDTRYDNGLAAPLRANTPTCFQISGRGVIPTSATAVTGNLTVTDETEKWAIYLGPDPVAYPSTSTLNFTKGDVIPNGVTVALGTGLPGSGPLGYLCATYMSWPGNTTALVFDATGYFTPDVTGATYHAVTPVRLLDTRYENGLPGPLRANTPACFQITGRDVIPTIATAVTGNLTVTDETASWAIYVGPDPIASPSTSTLNFAKGDIRANGVTIALGTGAAGSGPSGSLCATYMAPPGNTTSLIFDITGYFTQNLTGARFVPLTPARLLDTRSDNGLPDPLTANTPACFAVSGRGGVPTNAIAVTGNLTVTDETEKWAIALGPDPVANPTTSTLNFFRGDIRANGVAVKLGTGQPGSGPAGYLCATYMSWPGNTTSLVFDVTGYFVK